MDNYCSSCGSTTPKCSKCNSSRPARDTGEVDRYGDLKSGDKISVKKDHRIFGGYSGIIINLIPTEGKATVSLLDVGQIEIDLSQIERTPTPDSEKLKQFYFWLREAIITSHTHYNRGGQHAGHCWLTPSVRQVLERTLRDMEVLPEGDDFPWTYCEKCGNHYTMGLYDLDGKKVCGACYTAVKHAVKENK